MLERNPFARKKTGFWRKAVSASVCIRRAEGLLCNLVAFHLLSFDGSNRQTGVKASLERKRISFFDQHNQEYSQYGDRNCEAGWPHCFL